MCNYQRVIYGNCCGFGFWLRKRLETKIRPVVLPRFANWCLPRSVVTWIHLQCEIAWSLSKTPLNYWKRCIKHELTNELPHHAWNQLTKTLCALMGTCGNHLNCKIADKKCDEPPRQSWNMAELLCWHLSVWWYQSLFEFQDADLRCFGGPQALFCQPLESMKETYVVKMERSGILKISDWLACRLTKNLRTSVK